jgi:RHS repeat-associated protein
MIAREQAGTLRYLHQDRLSTRLMTDGSGLVVGTMDHLPYGEDAATGAGETEKHRFTSYERDTESGTDYAINRQHQYSLGRFNQADAVQGSIANPQSLNRYSYTLNDPVNLVDPEGLAPFPNLMGIVNYLYWYVGPSSRWVKVEAGAPGFDPNGMEWGTRLMLTDNEKLAPLGFSSKERLSDKACDEWLARIFGGEGAVVGSTHDPRSLDLYKIKEGGPVPRDRGHGPAPYNHPDPSSPDRGGIIHIYGNAQGTATNVGLYAPPGGTVGPIQKTGRGNTQRRVRYNTGLTITFVHLTATSERDRNDMGSVRIGNIGGPVGADNPGYIHTHIVFFSDFSNGIRVDPRKVFCGQ